MADDQYYLSRAHQTTAASESLGDDLADRIAQLGERIGRRRAQISTFEPLCRRRVDAWVAGELKRLSRTIRCDPSYEPLCCK